MKAYNSSTIGAIIRFYLMMAVIIIAGFVGQWWLAIFSLPIFLSIMMGYPNAKPEAEVKETNETKVIQMERKEERKVG